MELVYIEGGCFQMGDFSGAGSADERPVHEVCLDDFDIGKYPVTQAQWKNIMGSNPSYFKKCGDKCPVENVTWKEIDMFIGRLNTQTGKAFRLPTEAEWEFAARSRDKDEKWSGTDDKDELYEYAWYLENSDYETHPVGLKKPNAAGLYDMTGNVWQWTKDWYKENYYAKSPKDNPEGAYKGKKYVLRGGSWFMAADDARLTVRYQGEPALRINDAGIRLVLPKRRD
jgi:formylglycine-generating enzyme required for sulfatase activity